MIKNKEINYIKSIIILIYLYFISLNLIFIPNCKALSPFPSPIDSSLRTSVTGIDYGKEALSDGPSYTNEFTATSSKVETKGEPLDNNTTVIEEDILSGKKRFYVLNNLIDAGLESKIDKNFSSYGTVYGDGGMMQKCYDLCRKGKVGLKVGDLAVSKKIGAMTWQALASGNVVDVKDITNLTSESNPRLEKDPKISQIFNWSASRIQALSYALSGKDIERSMFDPMGSSYFRTKTGVKSGKFFKKSLLTSREVAYKLKKDSQPEILYNNLSSNKNEYDVDITKLGLFNHIRTTYYEDKEKFCKHYPDAESLGISDKEYNTLKKSIENGYVAEVDLKFGAIKATEKKPIFAKKFGLTQDDYKNWQACVVDYYLAIPKEIRIKGEKYTPDNGNLRQQLKNFTVAASIIGVEDGETSRNFIEIHWTKDIDSKSKQGESGERFMKIERKFDNKNKIYEAKIYDQNNNFIGGLQRIHSGEGKNINYTMTFYDDQEIMQYVKENNVCSVRDKFGIPKGIIGEVNFILEPRYEYLKLWLGSPERGIRIEEERDER